MRPARVLIVDDSVVIRRSLAEALTREPEVKLAEAAATGQIALTKMPQFRPDVVVLDIEIPDHDTLTTLAAIREAYPHTPVLMLSLSTDRAAAATLEALALGAKDYVTKPDAAEMNDETLRIVSRELVTKIRLHCSHLLSGPSSVGSAAPARPSPGTALDEPQAGKRIDVVAIGISTGGPSALMDLIPRIPGDFPVPILIVQHMPPMFTKILADRLNAKANVLVTEAGFSETARPGVALIAPGDLHLSLIRDGGNVRARTHHGAPEQSCRPSVDVLFRSAAQVYGSHVLAVVMTGMGRDGLEGCRQIHAAGGQIIVQDEATSVVWGMPRVVVKAGLVDQIVPLPLLAKEIVERVGAFRDRKPAAAVASAR